MAENEIIVLAKVKAKNGSKDQLADLALSMVEPTRAETGCIKYDLHQSSDDSGAFMFYEIWKSKDALDQHIATPHLQNFLEKTRDILAEPLDVTIWKKIS